MHTAYLIAHALPLDDTPQPSPVVVASITADPAYIGSLNPEAQLRVLAGKMGLLDFEIVRSDAQEQPGYQFELPFPSVPKRR